MNRKHWFSQNTAALSVAVFKNLTFAANLNRYFNFSFNLRFDSPKKITIIAI